jgi:hypothetical protein
VTVVRPQFEPTLPALVRRRFGVRERVTIGLVVGAVVLIAVAALVVRPRVDSVSKLSYDGEPAFNLLYANGALHEADPRSGELARLEGRRGRQSVTITARPLALPPYEGDVAHGLLPVYASAHIESLARELDHFQLLEEHRTRINGAPGYEVRFRSGQTTFGTDTMLLPDEEDARGAVLLSMRRTVDGKLRLGKREKAFADLASEAFRSFEFGAGRS